MTGDFGTSELAALRRLNELRSLGASAEREALEANFEARFGVASRLAVYGTLAPGGSNHGQVAELAGSWTKGLTVRGALFSTEWSGMPGFPAFRWSMEGDEIAVQVFESQRLPGHWRRLDRFEGPGYERILVPVAATGRIVGVANIYQALSLEGG